MDTFCTTDYSRKAKSSSLREMQRNKRVTRPVRTWRTYLSGTRENSDAVCVKLIMDMFCTTDYSRKAKSSSLRKMQRNKRVTRPVRTWCTYLSGTREISDAVCVKLIMDVFYTTDYSRKAKSSSLREMQRNKRVTRPVRTWRTYLSGTREISDAVCVK